MIYVCKKDYATTNFQLWMKLSSIKRVQELKYRTKANIKTVSKKRKRQSSKQATRLINTKPLQVPKPKHWTATRHTKAGNNLRK